MAKSQRKHEFVKRKISQKSRTTASTDSGIGAGAHARGHPPIKVRDNFASTVYRIVSDYTAMRKSSHRATSGCTATPAWRDTSP